MPSYWRSGEGRVILEVAARWVVDEAAKRGKTILLVTHDPATAGRAARQVRMAAGNIVHDTADDKQGEST